MFCSCRTTPLPTLQKLPSLLRLTVDLKSFLIKYEFHVDVERMIVKNARNVKKFLRRWFKKMYDRIPLPKGRIAAICKSTKLIFVGYGQLYSTNFFAPGMNLDIQHLGAGHCFRSDSSFREIPIIMYPRSITIDILEYHRFLKPHALLSSADRRHNKV